MGTAGDGLVVVRGAEIDLRAQYVRDALNENQVHDVPPSRSPNLRRDLEEGRDSSSSDDDEMRKKTSVSPGGAKMSAKDKLVEELKAEISSRAQSKHRVLRQRSQFSTFGDSDDGASPGSRYDGVSDQKASGVRSTKW